ncbi:MAG: ATPase, T2SS/T4P/T4SS family [Anaerovoracaceae bacterium]
MKNIPIGEVLKEYGYVTEAQIEEALKVQKQTKGKRLGKLLVELGFVTESQLLLALAKRLELPLVDLHSTEIDLKAVEEIPKKIANQYKLICIAKEGNSLTVAMSDPLDFYAIEDIRQITQKSISIVLDLTANIEGEIQRCYAEVGTKQAFKKADSSVDQIGITNIETIENTGNEAPIVQAFNQLLLQGYSLGASDVHIEPFEGFTQVRMRVDGVITETAKFSTALHLSLIARLKILSDMDIAERRLPQDGHFHLKIDGREMHARISVIPTVYGEKAVIRFLYTNEKVDNLETFGMTEENYAKFVNMLKSPHGIIYITGPTGSGKTTTLYMVLEKIADNSINVSTIEDPVERNIAQVNQMQVNATAGLTFEEGLRAILRQDPDIIMVGETRDSETAEISVRAAITGHQVFSTLHTNDAISAIVRLRDMGIPSYMVANSIVGLVAQRLMRKVCPYCGESYQTSPEEMKSLRIKTPATIKRGKGCAKCGDTGYKGRRSIHEVILIDKNLRRMIAEDADIGQLSKYITDTQNFEDLYTASRKLVLAGVTTIDEFYKIAYYAD